MASANVNALGYIIPSSPAPGVEVASYTSAELTTLTDLRAGTIVYDSELGLLEYWNGTAFEILTQGTELVLDSVALTETGGGTDKVTLVAPSSIAASFTLKLPTSVGLVNQVLSTDGLGNMSWATVAATGTFLDNVFMVQNAADHTRAMVVSAASVAPGTTRTLTMPNTDVDLGQIATNTGNLAALQLDVDGFPDALKNLTTTEINQLENIGAATISATEWGYVAAQDQSVATTATPQFVALRLSELGALGDYCQLQMPSLAASYTLTLPASAGAASQVLTTDGTGVLSWTSPTSGTFFDNVFQIQDNADHSRVLMFEVGGIAASTTRTITMPDANVNLAQIATNTGNIASLQLDVDGFPDALKNLTTAEINQLENIGASTISSTNWGYLAAMDQAVATTDAVSHTTVSATVALRLKETGVGTDYISIAAPAALVGGYSLVLPTDDGTVGQSLTTDGSGVLSWTTVTGGPTFLDNTFRIQDSADATRQIAFEAGTVAAATTRTITMPDTDISLGQIATNTSNISAAQSDIDGFPDALKNLTTAEVNQLENIGANTISAATWGYVSALDQSVATGASPTFVTPTCTGSLKLQDPGVGTNTVTLQAPTLVGDYSLTLPAADGSASQLLKTNGSGVLSWTDPVVSDATFRIQDNGDATRQIAFEASTVAAATTRTITMPNSDVNLGQIATIQSDLDGFPDGLKSLTADEVSQLQNIGTTTVSALTWGYMGGMDQAVATTSSVQFGTTTSRVIVNNSMQRKLTAIGVATVLDNTHHVVFASTTVASYNITLPLAATYAGIEYTIIFRSKTGAFTVSVVRSGADTIDGTATTITLNNQHERIRLLSDGVGVWYTNV